MTLITHKKLQFEDFTANRLGLKPDTVYRLDIGGGFYSPAYLQNLGDRFRVFQTKSFGEHYTKSYCTEMITDSCHGDINDAVDRMIELGGYIENNQPILD